MVRGCEGINSRKILDWQLTNLRVCISQSLHIYAKIEGKGDCLWIFCI